MSTYSQIPEKTPETLTVWQAGTKLHQSHRRVGTKRSETMKRARRDHGAIFKAQVALAAVKGEKMLTELAEQFRVPPLPDHGMEATTAGTGGGRIW